MVGSKNTAILLKLWIWPIDAVALGRICAQHAKQSCFYGLTQSVLIGNIILGDDKASPELQKTW